MKDIFNQSSFENIEPCKFYIGIDPTSTKLHVGHFYLFKVCDYLISKGFEMILLIGDKTAKIGDPTDKSKTRKTLNNEEVKSNVEEILKQLPKLNFEIVYNSSFTHDIEFFKHFSVPNLLKNKTFLKRIENNEGLSLLEFLYPVIQGLDFYFLRKQNNVKFQIGGQDQWFNMITGLNFISKKYDDCNIATLPLITTKNGEKIGKTQNKEELNSFQVWQLFRNLRDENVDSLLRAVSDFTNEDINKKKMFLANIIVSFIFGEEEAIKCENKAKELFKK